MSLDEHMIEIGVLVIGFASNFGVMRWMLGKHEASIEKMVEKLNVQDTEQKLQKQKVDEHETTISAFRESKHNHANRIQGAEFKITMLEEKIAEMEVKLDELDRRRKR